MTLPPTTNRSSRQNRPELVSDDWEAVWVKGIFSLLIPDANETWLESDRTTPFVCLCPADCLAVIRSLRGRSVLFVGFCYSASYKGGERWTCESSHPLSIFLFSHFIHWLLFTDDCAPFTFQQSGPKQDDMDKIRDLMLTLMEHL